MKDIIVKIIVWAIIVCILILGIPMIIEDEKNTYYICKDTFGNTIYLEYVYGNRGTYYGYTEDGTYIVIVEFKRVKRGVE